MASDVTPHKPGDDRNVQIPVFQPMHSNTPVGSAAVVEIHDQYQALSVMGKQDVSRSHFGMREDDSTTTSIVQQHVLRIEGTTTPVAPAPNAL